MERKKNIVTIVGSRLSTLPTPLQTPSITREWTTGLTCAFPSRASSRAITLSIPIPIRSDSAAPIKLNVITNTSAMIPIKQGMAVYFPVKIRSMAILRLCSLLSWGRTTAFTHKASINENLILARAASRSSPVSISKTDTRFSNMSPFSDEMESFFFIRRSFSTIFVTAKRTGIPFFFASGSNICTAA